jgi:competence ComEA-like helix-hairpin-helix protein
MGLYTRPQLLLLLALLAAAGVGLGVKHWRATHPEIAERLERLDREVATSQGAGADARETGPPAETVRTPPGQRSESKSRPSGGSRAPKRRSATPDQPSPPLDLNHATPADLMQLPGVGPVLARRIVEARESAGRFGAVDDLAGVRGLGRAKLERLRPLVAVLE